MKRHWFKTLMGVLAVTGLSVATLFSTNQADAYQAASTPSGVFITVGNPPDGTNVRNGPNSVDYGPPIGHLNPGDTVPAIGKSRGGDWIQIEYAAGPNGKGWVYSVYVVVSGGELPVVESPPTATPPVTATIDPTFAAAFNIQPTQTRLPTFTPPPPLTVPEFPDEGPSGSTGIVFGIFILGLGVIGSIGLLVSYILRK